ncbi:MAG TPA: tetratricopeptide repeat protein [Herpetosiphonaceae bacterium]|nr:tetratricopeptide repeat protein [Herpetosiphonaceae bacterium]
MFEPAKLPIYATNLIGRVRECAEITHLLAHSTRRILTLIGESGAGKTRVALEVAKALEETFSDGIVFVNLAPVQDPAFVVPTIATALDIKERPEQRLLDRVTDMLQQKAMLLILDNMEQVSVAAPDLLHIVQGTEKLTLLVTSQIPLGIPQETTYPIPPLDRPPTDGYRNARMLAHYPAVELFVNRFQSGQPSFCLTAANASAVARICHLLDGFPLAIEIVAAHSPVLSPNDVLLLLRNHLGIQAHQQGRLFSSRTDILNPILDWSVRHLPPLARDIMHTLGVFLGGWTIESAHAVLAPQKSLEEVEAALALLVQKHLILSNQQPDQSLRFTTLDAIRSYSDHALSQSGHAPAIYERYADYYIQLGRSSQPAQQGCDQQLWLQRLETEYHNIRAVLHWSHIHDRERFIALTATLGWFWRTHCRLSEATLWLEHALRQSEHSSAQYSTILYEAGIAALMRNSVHEAQTYLQQALEIYQDAGNRTGIAETLNELGTLYCLLDALVPAQATFERCIEAWKDLGNVWPQAVATANLGYVYLLNGLYDQAIATLREAEALLADAGDQVLQGSILTNLGWAAFFQEDAEAARDYFQQAIRVHTAIDSQFYLPEQLEGLAGASSLLGDCEHSALLLGSADTLRGALAAPVPAMDAQRLENIIETVRRQLDGTRFTRLWNQGASLSVEQITAIAGAELQSVHAPERPPPCGTWAAYPALDA